MNIHEARAIVTKTVRGHTRIVRLMSEPTHDPYAQERDEDEDDWRDSISRDATWHLAQVALFMVAELAGSWRDTTASEFAEFLNECGLNGEWVASYIPQDATPEDVLGY